MKYDAILALGRGIKPDGSLPDSAQAVVKTACKLFDANVAPRIIISGKWSRRYEYVPPQTEASAMKRLALAMGVQPEAIIIEEEAMDTISNLYFVKIKLLLPNKWNKILLLVVAPQDKRPPFLARYILGSDFRCDIRQIDFEFPSEKREEFDREEVQKLSKLQQFFTENSVQTGDHEKIFKIHLNYVKKNQGKKL